MIAPDLLSSLCGEIEAAIRRTEEDYARLVLADFRDGLECRTYSEQVRWCLRWMDVYGLKRYGRWKKAV